MIKISRVITCATILTAGSLTLVSELSAGWISDPTGYSMSPPGKGDVPATSELSREAIANLYHWPESNPNYRWMQMALERNLKGPPSPFKGRGLALLNLAIHDAITIAETKKLEFERPRPAISNPRLPMPNTFSYPSSHAAAAAAAAGVLSYLFPNEKAVFEERARLAGQARIDAGVSYKSDVTAGRDLGREVAANVIAYAENDGSDQEFSGVRPTGPDKLKGDVFVYPTAGDWQPFAIASTEKFIPPAPPAIDSKQMEEQLDELMRIERNVPTAIRAWVNHSTWRAYNWWYEKLATAVFEEGSTTTAKDTALAYATISAANHDAILACFKAKYTYWLIRPAQLKPDLPALFPNPPHPSYPAAHSCSAMSYAVSMSNFFPQHATELYSAAEEAGYSRLIGGIHYRVDKDAGEMIGKDVAEEVIRFSSNL